MLERPGRETLPHSLLVDPDNQSYTYYHIFDALLTHMHHTN